MNHSLGSCLRRLRLRWGGVFFLPVAVAQAAGVQIDLVPAFAGGHCQDALVRNLTSRTLQINLNYVVKGTQGAYYSSTQSIGGGTFNGGANTGYYMTGLAPGAVVKVPVHNIVAVPCDMSQTVSTSYTTYDVDAHNQRVGNNESSERRALGQMIDNWNNQDKVRQQEREQKKREEAARLAEEEKKRKQTEYQQMMQRQMESNRQRGEETMREIRAGMARQEAENEAERRRIQAEMARGQAERDAYNREAQAKVAKAQADWQAQQAAAQRAAQAEQARQATLAAERAAREQRRQVQWQQQVELTGSLLQSSIQSSESALAGSQQKLNQIEAAYDQEGDALADMLLKAKAAAQARK